jgi:paraquat-inducible protein B
MTNQKRYAMIGMFVVGALFVASIGIAVFFGGDFGRGKVRALMVFRGNVTGLETGTPVQFRGMKIGEVKRVRTIYHPDTQQVLFPVYAEFTGVIEVPGYEARNPSGGVKSAWIGEMVDRGLRAQLQTKSFVTGQQMIMLDFVTGKPPEFTKLEPNALEIPTVRSPNEALFDTIKELPVRELVLDGHRLLANLNGMVQDGEGKPGALPAMLADLAKLSRTLDAQVPAVAGELVATTRETRALLGSVRTTLDTFASATRSLQAQAEIGGTAFADSARDFRQLTGGLQRSVADLDRLMVRVDGSLGRVDQTLGQVGHLLSEDSTLGAGLHDSLTEIAAAAQSLRFAADGLTRRPESLIFGRKNDNTR